MIRTVLQATATLFAATALCAAAQKPENADLSVPDAVVGPADLAHYYRRQAQNDNDNDSDDWTDLPDDKTKDGEAGNPIPPGAAAAPSAPTPDANLDDDEPIIKLPPAAAQIAEPSDEEELSIDPRTEKDSSVEMATDGSAGGEEPRTLPKVSENESKNTGSGAAQAGSIGIERQIGLQIFGDSDEGSFFDPTARCTKEDKASCDANAECKHLPYGVGGECACKAGYVGKGKPGTCFDEDECMRDSDTCAAVAICQNTPGSYTCTCPDGYTGDGITCKEQPTKGPDSNDECASKTHACDAKASCYNTVTGYLCICNKGYTGEGKNGTCKDVDECAISHQSCSPQHGVCTNTEGSFTCACNDGFKGDGVQCLLDGTNTTSEDPLALVKEELCLSTENGYSYETDITRRGHALSLMGKDKKPVPTVNNGRLKLAWSIKGDRLEARVVFPFVAGWVAFGFTDRENNMANSHVIMGQVNGSIIVELNMTSHNPNGVYIVPRDSMSYADGTVVVSDGRTVLSFSRPLDAYPPVDPNKKVFVIYAYGPGVFRPHSHANRGSSTMILNSCMSKDTSTNVQAKIIIHGVLMFVAMGLSSPIAVLVARFMKLISSKTHFPALWFHLHWSLQVLALCLATAGFVLAFDLVPSDRHFSKPHHIVGVAVMGLFYFQPIGALFRPVKHTSAGLIATARKVWEFVHMNCGRICVLAGLANIALGLYEAESALWVLIVYYVHVGTLVILFLVGSYYLYKQEARERERLQARASLMSARLSVRTTNTISGVGVIDSKGKKGVLEAV